MLNISIPGGKQYHFEHLVLDYNGTIAEGGELVEGVVPLLQILAENLSVHIITADTHGTVAEIVHNLPCKLRIIGTDSQDTAKSQYINSLGKQRVVAMGNGRNDILMLKEAALGVGIIQAEGASAAIYTVADVICTSIHDAFNLLIKTEHLIATLRN